jgi:iron complex outermembrane receptor protein
VSYEISDNHYGYILAAKGFKSGGYNDQSGSGGFATFPLEAYDPEFARSYEIGLRSRFANDRLRLNATYFLVDYEDFQRSTVVSLPGTALQETRTFNAAEVKATGLELELFALLKENFTARLNIGLLGTDYEKFLLDRNLDGVFEDFSNREVVRAPELTAGIDLSYIKPLRSGHQLSWNMSFLYEDQSAYYYNDDVGAAYDTELEERTILNVSLTWRHANQKYWMSLFGKNLTDDRYKTASQAVGALWTYSNYGPPITYGIEIGARLME